MILRKAKILGVFLVLSLTPLSLQAAQNHNIEPDGSIVFVASTSEVTRVSVKGDRIRRIINDDTAFEMSNDDSTGDVYFRFSGTDPKRETGFIVTENGITIGYTLRPVSRAVEPVIITIKGDKSETEDDAGFGESVGFSDDIASSMADIVRSVAMDHVLGKKPGRGRNGTIVKKVSGQGWKATVRLAVADTKGRLVREQDFYHSGVRAIWIERPELGAGERTFVIVVEGL